MAQSAHAPLITFIVAMTRARVIGRDGGMPWHLPADLQHFATHTRGRPVVMGRRSHASIGRPLPRRHNIVLTRDPSLELPGCTVVGSAAAAIDAAGDVPEIMVIGGEAIYRLFLQRVRRALITLIDADIPGDTRFPELPGHWREVDRRERPPDAENPFSMTFLEYRR